MLKSVKVDQYLIDWLERVETNYEIDSEYVLKSLSICLMKKMILKKLLS